METKVCNKCKIEKPHSEYYKHKGGLYYICKPCHRGVMKDKMRDRREGDPEGVREYKRNYWNSTSQEYRDAENKRKSESFERWDCHWKMLIARQTGLHRDHVTPEMIELKKISVGMKRLAFGRDLGKLKDQIDGMV